MTNMSKQGPQKLSIIKRKCMHCGNVPDCSRKYNYTVNTQTLNNMPPTVIICRSLQIKKILYRIRITMVSFDKGVSQGSLITAGLSGDLEPPKYTQNKRLVLSGHPVIYGNCCRSILSPVTQHS